MEAGLLSFSYSTRMNPSQGNIMVKTSGRHAYLNSQVNICRNWEYVCWNLGIFCIITIVSKWSVKTETILQIEPFFLPIFFLISDVLSTCGLSGSKIYHHKFSIIFSKSLSTHRIRILMNWCFIHKFFSNLNEFPLAHKEGEIGLEFVKISSDAPCLCSVGFCGERRRKLRKWLKL